MYELKEGNHEVPGDFKERVKKMLAKGKKQDEETESAAVGKMGLGMVRAVVTISLVVVGLLMM